MKVFSRLAIALAFTLTAGLAGCDDPEPAADTQVAETTADAAVETSADVAVETIEDAAAETGEDAGPETVEDAAGETVEDAAGETVEDAAGETVEDAAGETVEDAAGETVEDAGAETVEDAGPETVEDAGAETVEDVAVDTSGDTLPPTCDYTGYIPVSQDAVNAFGGFLYIAQDTLGAPVDTLNIELFAGNGGATAAGTYELNGPDYANCGNCITVWKDCDENLANCAQQFLATSGTFTIDAYGGSGEAFSGTLTDVVLEEVVISGAMSTPVVDGERWCLESYSFNATIQ